MIEKLLLKLGARDELSREERDALRQLIQETERLAPRKTIVRHGEPLQRSVLLLEGMVCRYKDLRNGRRQITAIHTPGDFLDLHGFTLKTLDHDVMTLPASVVGYAPHTGLTRITETHPHLTRLLWLSTNLDAAIHREWELSLGQRSGSVRVAHLFCELQARLEIVGLARGGEFDLPMNQAELGECVGLTVVHTNRVLRELRQRELASFARGIVTIPDLPTLRRFADFDPAYLYLTSQPR